MNASFETTGNVHRLAEADMARLLTSIMTDGGPHLHEATVREVTVSAHPAVDDLHHMTSTTIEAMREGPLQETTAHHHQDDMMIHMTVEVLPLLHEAMILTLEEIHTLDHAVRLPLGDMAATVALATEDMTIAHIRCV